MGKQYGISFNPNKCVQCHACETACKSANNIEAGVKWRKVINVWEGAYPDVKNRSFSISCMHCADAPCVEACPFEAIEKRDDGIVIVEREKCTGCRMCFDACPFNIPQYGEDGRMQKCHLCFERIGNGMEPACVATCPAEALHFGTMDELSDQVMSMADYHMLFKTLKIQTS